MSERCPVCGQSDRPLFGALYIRVMGLASRENQTVGEKRDLYVTLEQIHTIMLQIAEEEQRGGS